MSRSQPPPLPSTTIHTRYWCEENIYLLAKYFSQQEAVKQFWDFFAVFISNETKSVALWNQTLAQSEPPDNVIVWDYHVVLVLRPKTGTMNRPPILNVGSSSDVLGLFQYAAESWMYDLDTTLAIPCRSTEYISGTFMLRHYISERYLSLFRVVPGVVFLDYFASDRSHMISVTEKEAAACQPIYRVPPPPYPPVCGSIASEQGITNNLMANFVSMEQSDGSPYGVVMDMDAFEAWCVAL